MDKFYRASTELLYFKDQLNKLTLNLNRGRYETVIIESRRLIKLNPNVAGLYEIPGLAYSQSGETKTQ